MAQAVKALPLVLIVAGVVVIPVSFGIADPQTAHQIQQGLSLLVHLLAAIIACWMLAKSGHRRAVIIGVSSGIAASMILDGAGGLLLMTESYNAPDIGGPAVWLLGTILLLAMVITSTVLTYLPNQRDK